MSGNARVPHLACGLMAVCATAALLSACAASRDAPGAQLIEIGADDYGFSIPAGTIAAGPSRLEVSNLGPGTHELILARSDLAPEALPLQRDGLTVDENSPKLRTVATIEDIPVDETRSILADLRPGRYVVYCNLEGHYLADMVSTIQVVEP